MKIRFLKHLILMKHACCGVVALLVLLEWCALSQANAGFVGWLTDRSTSKTVGS
jgi:hypothetical protein